MSENAAVLAPIPRASEHAAAIDTTGVAHSARNDRRRSWSTKSAERYCRSYGTEPRRHLRLASAERLLSLRRTRWRWC